MAKAKKATKAAATKAAFVANTHVTERSLVIDANGVAWWVDPHDQTITKA